MKAVKITEGIHHIGVNITNNDLFEGLWPIPDGVSLNSYVVQGKKNAVIDLVRDWNDAPAGFTEKLRSIGLSAENIDYLILNHLEPDHTGWLREFKKKNPRVEIITTPKGAALVKQFYGIEEAVREVKTGDSLDLGDGRVLNFIEAPNVHWPETMVTYETSGKVLFSCDAFGSYGALGDAVFDDQLSQEHSQFYEREALRYYANIVASFSKFVERAAAKLEGVEINVIAPSHGIIWRENPSVIIERYLKYASYMDGPAEPEITLIWGTMYGNTGSAVNEIIRSVRSEGVPIHVHQVPQDDSSYILASAWKSAGLIIGMPTYEYRMFPPMANVLDLFDRKHVKNKKVLRFGSFGWSGGAQKECDALTEKLKWDYLEPVEWNGAPSQDDTSRLLEQVRTLARKVKESAG
ncbi:MAG: FprA family A-type flavoprotein [Spirochaetia bacterium]